MAIEQAEAFGKLVYKTRDGELFATAEPAYHAERQSLDRRLGAIIAECNVPKLGWDKKAFRKLVGLVRAWVAEAEASLGQMSGEGGEKGKE